MQSKVTLPESVSLALPNAAYMVKLKMGVTTNAKPAPCFVRGEFGVTVEDELFTGRRLVCTSVGL